MQARNASGSKRKLLLMLFSDGYVGKNRICFTSTDQVLIEEFRKCCRGLFNKEPKIYRLERKAKEARLYSSRITKELLELARTFRTKPCSHFPQCKEARSDGSCGIHKTMEFDGVKYPVLKPPENLDKEDLKLLFSMEGGVAIYPRISKKDYLNVERKIFLACQHPILRSKYISILSKLGLEFMYDKRNRSIAIRDEKSIIKFKEEIGFVKGVKVSLSSSHWYGTEKNRLLDLAIWVSKQPKGYWKQFETKEQILNHLRMILTHAKTLQWVKA